MKPYRSLRTTGVSSLRRAATLGLAAAALPMAGLATLTAAAPANAAAATCVGTVKVTSFATGDTGVSLGRLSYAASFAQVSTDPAAWLQVTPDAAMLSGGIGDLLVDGSTALGGILGGVNEAPLNEMSRGTGDNVIFKTGAIGKPTSAATSTGAYVSSFWSIDDSGALEVKWTQPNSDVLDMAIYYRNSRYAGAAADFSAFNTAAGPTNVPISYTFVPNVGLEEACGFPTPLSITGEVTSDVPVNEAGWYRTSATVTYTCTGGTAPLVCPTPYTRDNTKTGFAVTRKVTDATGQEVRTSTPLQVDTTAPQVTAAVTGTAPFARDARPISCTATDRRSGLDGDCTVAYGEIVPNAKGRDSRRWIATATDVAGNTASTAGTFRVTAAP